MLTYCINVHGVACISAALPDIWIIVYTIPLSQNTITSVHISTHLSDTTTKRRNLKSKMSTYIQCTAKTIWETFTRTCIFFHTLLRPDSHTSHVRTFIAQCNNQQLTVKNLKKNMSCLSHGIHAQTEHLGFGKHSLHFGELHWWGLTGWLNSSGHDSVRYGTL